MEVGTFTIVAGALFFSSLAARWRVPAVPKPIASGLLAASLVVLAWTVCPHATRQAWWIPAGAALLGALIVGVIDALFLGGGREGEAESGAPAPVADQRVTSTGQSGGITARTVNQGNGERFKRP